MNHDQADCRSDHKPTPFLKPVEKGRDMMPEYGNDRGEFDVNTAEWTHVCCARFGPARPCSFSNHTKWTGDSYRYDIFKRDGGTCDVQYALRWWNGSGEGWLVSKSKDRRHETNLLSFIAEIADESRRWDACHFIWETQAKTRHAAVKETAHKYRTAFVNGKLKKRKKRGTNTYTVEIVN